MKYNHQIEAKVKGKSIDEIEKIHEEEQDGVEKQRELEHHSSNGSHKKIEEEEEKQTNGHKQSKEKEIEMANEENDLKTPDQLEELDRPDCPTFCDLFVN